MTTSRRILASVALVGAVAYCGGDAPPEDGRPTDGSSPALELHPAWSSSDTLLLTYPALAAADGRGRVYVYDVDAGILLFDADGAAIRAIGRRGEGPGEYSDVRQISILPGDSLLILDPRLLRVSVFDPDGRFAYAHSLSEATSGPAVLVPVQVARSTDGTGYLVLTSPLGDPREWTSGEVEEWFVVRRVRLNGALDRDSVLVLPRGTSFRVVRTVGDGVNTHYFGNPLSPHASLVVEHGGRIHYARGDSLRIRIFDEDGSEVGGFTAPRELHPVTDEDIERAIEPYQGRGSSAAETIRAHAPEFWPALWDFLVDDEGRTWVSPAPGAKRLDDLAWDVFRSSGERVGSVRLPPRFVPLEVRANRVYGVTRDSLDVPTVRALDVVGE